jgi:hypothetical protein
MTQIAQGSFEVELNPQGAAEKISGSSLGRMLLHKRFHGDLEASSAGEMLTARTDIEGSAGYVAIERVTGVLQHRKGSFVLQHYGTLARGVPQQTITIVPDSGSAELSGISGSMTITIVDKKHYYRLDYSLADKLQELI